MQSTMREFQEVSRLGSLLVLCYDLDHLYSFFNGFVVYPSLDLSLEIYSWGLLWHTEGSYEDRPIVWTICGQWKQLRTVLERFRQHDQP